MIFYYKWQSYSFIHQDTLTEDKIMSAYIRSKTKTTSKNVVSPIWCPKLAHQVEIEPMSHSKADKL